MRFRYYRWWFLNVIFTFLNILNKAYMKRLVAFIMILFFSVLFMAAYLPYIYNGPYEKKINFAGQAGLSVSILLFFIFNHKKKTPPKPNGE